MNTKSFPNTSISFFRLPFKHRQYGKLWIAQLVNNIGNQFTYLALQFLVFSLTGSTLAMGILTIAQAIPMITIGPYAGAIVDRFDRKKLMVVSNLVQGLWLFCIPLTIILPYRVLGIYVLGFLMGTVNRFFFPSRGSSIPKLVSKNDLLSANSLSAATYQLSALIGPVTASFTVLLFGYDIAFYIDAIGFLVSALFIQQIKTNLKPDTHHLVSSTDNSKPEAIKSSSSVLTDLKDAYGYLREYTAFAFIMLLFTSLMFGFGSSLPLIVPYLHVIPNPYEPEFAFGMMSSFAAVMGLIIAVIVGNRKNLPRPITLMNLACFVAAMVMFGFSIATDVYFVAICWAFFGMIQVFVMIPFQTLTQETIPDSLRGKMFSFFNILISTAQILGMAFGGILGDIIGYERTFFINGLLIIVPAAIGMLILFWKNYEQDVQIRRDTYKSQAPSPDDLSKAVPTGE